VSVLIAAAGAILIGLAALDAITTTLAASTAAGPLTSRLGRWWWRAAHRLARRPDSRWLTSAGPAVAVLTLGTWLLWAGWTLVFSASPEAVLQDPEGVPADGWARAYFAGFSVFTLGVGDYVPNGPVWQLLTVVAVVSGLALTTMAITYLVPVVSAVTQRRQQASSIAGLGTTPPTLILNGWNHRGWNYLEHRLAQLADAITLTAERHRAYPILHYFHSAEPEQELRAQLAVLDDAVTLLQLGSRDGPHPAVLAEVRQAVELLLERAGTPAHGTPPPPLTLTPLRAAGLALVDEHTFARRLAELDEHRRRLYGFAVETKWEPDDTPADTSDRP
jgi:hypothetical protein